MDELQRAKIREKILSYPYSKQVDILNYIIRDSLLFDRSGSFNYCVEQVLNSVFTCILMAAKSKNYKFHYKIHGKKGALCEFASLSGAICCVINEYILSDGCEMNFDVDIDKEVFIKMQSDNGNISSEVEKILNNTAQIHGGSCLFLKGDYSAVILRFPYKKGKAMLIPPSPIQMIDDKYSVVRIILHKLF